MEDELKVGARNSKKDQERLQMMHDFSVENGAMCQVEEGKHVEVEEVIAFGDTIKAVKLDDGSVKFGGYLVRFGDEDNTDLTGDYFTKNTDFGDMQESDVYFNHRLPVSADGVTIEYKAKLSRAKITKDDVGVFAETIVKARNEYEQAIIEAGLANKLGWSSGTAGHLVDRAPSGKAWQIKTWILGLDASLTPTPAEPRNSVMPIKSLIPSETAATDKDATKMHDPILKEPIMNDELKALFDQQKEDIKSLVQTEAKAAAKTVVDEFVDKLPEVKAQLNGGQAQVTKDPADYPFKSVADQMNAMKQLATSGRVDPRLKRIQKLSADWMAGNDDGVKALLGSNETIPSQGEFLLEPTISAEFLKPLHEDGPITSLARRMPVGPNSVSGWINGIDETARTTGNRWGGVRGYWVAEGDAMTASQPKFKRINWELHQLAVLQYATDNMLKDAQLMNSVINQSSMEELKFLVNDAFFRGTGVGQPKGFGTSATNAALISAVRTNATNIDHDDITRMKMRVPASAWSRLVWLANPDTMAEIDTLNFTAGTTGILSPYVTYGPDGVTRIAGRPVIYNEFSPTLGTLGDLLLWDPQDYLYWEGAGIEGASSIHVQFLTNQTVFRFIYRVDGMPASYSAITPYQGTSSVSAYVGLAATT